MGIPVISVPTQTLAERDQPTTLELEHQMVGNRAVTFRVSDVSPPSALYVTQDDALFVQIANTQTGASIIISATFLLPDGRVQPMQWNVNPPASGAQTSYLYPLAEGYLLNATVTPHSTPMRRGSTWVYISIRRGSIATGVNLQTIISDYLDSYSGPTWPGGQLKTPTDGTGLAVYTFAGNQAAGADYNYTVPSYARVRLRSIAALFSASATVGNRNVFLWTNDPAGNTIYQDNVAPVVTAGNSLYVTWGLLAGASQETAVAGSSSRTWPDILLNPGCRIVLSWGTKQAGDSLNYVAMNTEQWFST